MAADGQVRLAEGLHVAAGFSQRRLASTLDIAPKLDNYIQATATYRSVSNRVGGSYSFNYDIGRNTLLTSRIIGSYNVQCCGFAVEYQTYNFPQGTAGFPVAKDRRFNFSFTLSGLGTFSNFFGAMGGSGLNSARDTRREAMKGLILSGGKGTRLRPLTYTSAKQLVPIANKPVLFYGLEAMADAGIRQVGIVVGDTGAEIRAAVGDGSRWGLEVTYIEQDAPRGLAHAVLISEPYLGHEPFVMYLGDNLLNRGIRRFVEQFAATTAGGADPADARAGPADVRRRGTQDGKVVGLVEKPKEPKSDLALVGVYMFGPEIFDSVKRIRPSARNELEITDAIQDLIDRGLDVRPHIVDGWWKDTGKLEDMLEANRLILDTLERRVEGTVDAASRIEGKVVVEPGAVVERSIVRGPGDHRRPRPHHPRLRRAVHVDHERRRDPRCGDRAQHRARGQRHQRPAEPRRGQPDRQQRPHLPRAREAVRLPVHAGRQLGGRHSVVKEPS